MAFNVPDESLKQTITTFPNSSTRAVSLFCVRTVIGSARVSNLCGVSCSISTLSQLERILTISSMVALAQYSIIHLFPVYLHSS